MFKKAEDVDYFGKTGFGEGISSGVNECSYSEEDWGLSDEHPDF